MTGVQTCALPIWLELVEPESRVPVRGAHSARIWGRVLPALAGGEPWALDFVSHLERVRDYCGQHGVVFREAAARCLVIPAPDAEALAALLERFAGETFGVRAGGAAGSGDAALEKNLSHRGVDAYHHVLTQYFFCAVCDFENGFLTLLTNRLWASEVVRRLRPALGELDVEVTLPRS